MLLGNTPLFLSIICFCIVNAASFPKRALSPSLKTPSPEYVRLLDHSMMFYEAQRSGKLPADNRIPWRHDSALNDGSEANMDLAGGYYDAGDYLKLTFPLCYTVFMLSWGGSDYIEGYHLANQTNNLRTQIKWATDWLIKAHPHNSTLFVQVGDVKVDNSYFGPDSNIPLPRPCYQINQTDFGTDVAAMAAVAFSTAATFFNDLAKSSVGTQEDSQYAETLLVHATQLHNASYDILPRVRYHLSVPSIETAYASSDYKDELILSGIALYRATRNRAYLDQSLQVYKEKASNVKRTEPLDWDNKWGALYVLLAETLLNSNDQNEALQARIDAESYLDGIVSGETANRTGGGLLFWDIYSTENSNQNAMSTSHLLLSYSLNVLRPLAQQSNDNDAILAKIRRYEDLANSQLDYIFGKNPINQNYVVGERPNSPLYPHSAPASGFSSLKEAMKKPFDLSIAHTIYGALVGGPAKNDSFTDVRLDWSQTEVALDYNAPYQNVLAYQVMFNPKNPFYVPETSTDVDENEQNDNAIPVWGIILAVVLPVLLTSALIYLFLYFRRRRNGVFEKEIKFGDNNSNGLQNTQILGANDSSGASTSDLAFVNEKINVPAAKQQLSSADTIIEKQNLVDNENYRNSP